VNAPKYDIKPTDIKISPKAVSIYFPISSPDIIQDSLSLTKPDVKRRALVVFFLQLSISAKSFYFSKFSFSNLSFNPLILSSISYNIYLFLESSSVASYNFLLAPSNSTLKGNMD
jgi:hypothetical protein